MISRLFLRSGARKHAPEISGALPPSRICVIIQILELQPLAAPACGPRRKQNNRRCFNGNWKEHSPVRRLRQGRGPRQVHRRPDPPRHADSPAGPRQHRPRRRFVGGHSGGGGGGGRGKGVHLLRRARHSVPHRRTPLVHRSPPPGCGRPAPADQGGALFRGRHCRGGGGKRGGRRPGREAGHGAV